MVQWLGLPGWGAKIPQAVRRGQRRKEKKKKITHKFTS